MRSELGDQQMRVSPESIVDEVICSLSVVIINVSPSLYLTSITFFRLSRFLRSLGHTGICWPSSIPFSEVHLALLGALLYPSQKHNLLTQVLARARVAGCSLWEEHSERRYSR